MKTIKIQYSIYEVVSSLENANYILLLVKKPKGKKHWLAYQYPNGSARLSGEMPMGTTKENVWAK